tara:strand:+ start:560697 stop:561335 length:639 start_codon:yes stop_codon:yes gene_type:complete
LDALQRTLLTQDWLTFVLLSLLLIVFVLRGLSAEKLQGTFLALFNKGLVDIEIEERLGLFNPFQLVQYLFTIGVLAVSCFVVADYYNPYLNKFTVFTIYLGGVFGYFLLKRSLELGLANALQIQEGVHYYMRFKSIYLNSISFFLFAILIVFSYGSMHMNVFLTLVFILVLFRLILLVVYNKNLIFNHLFYFILYICAFEIAPLLILLKLML